MDERLRSKFNKLKFNLNELMSVEEIKKSQLEGSQNEKEFRKLILDKITKIRKAIIKIISTCRKLSQPLRKIGGITARTNVFLS